MISRYSKQAEKFLDKQSDTVFNRIITAVDKLPEGDVRKMAGYKDLYRLRVGKFRILYKMESGNVFVDKIESRGQAYKD